jgi:hypothetical protein
MHTLKRAQEKIVKRFPDKRVIAVADRGFLSIDNLADLQTVTLPGVASWNLFWRYRTDVTANSWSC